VAPAVGIAAHFAGLGMNEAVITIVTGIAFAAVTLGKLTLL